jgi:hypothetical protein
MQLRTFPRPHRPPGEVERPGCLIWSKEKAMFRLGKAFLSGREPLILSQNGGESNTVVE